MITHFHQHVVFLVFGGQFLSTLSKSSIIGRQKVWSETTKNKFATELEIQRNIWLRNMCRSTTNNQQTTSVQSVFQVFNKKIRKFSVSIEFWFQKPRISERMSRCRISQGWKCYIGVPLYESWFQSWLCWWCFDHVFNHQNVWYFILEIIVFSRKL